MSFFSPPLRVLCLCLFCFLFLPEYASSQTGKVGINTTAPAAVLHVADSSVVFTGPAGLPGTPGATPVQGAGNRFMWYADKAAFRAGGVDGTQWDGDSIGVYSAIVGGINSQATGLHAFVGGGHAHMAKGVNSFIGGGIGSLTQASNTFVGGGVNGNAAGARSFVGGGELGQVFGTNGFVGGGFDISVWDSHSAGVGGFNNDIGGRYAFIGGGSSNESAGWYSFIGGGRGNSAPSLSEVAFGLFPIPYTAASADSFVPSDRLFVLGNGTSVSTPSNALTILKNGRTGLGTDQPAARLHVLDSSVVFTGPAVLPGTPGAPPVSGAGIRMMWYPDKAAFRVGRVAGDEWNKDSVGIYSMAFGWRLKAIGLSSFAGGGLDNVALGLRSFVGGGSTNLASGTNSFVGGGFSCTTSGTGSFVGGATNSTASASYSFIGGGTGGTASANYAFIGGGNSNTASGIVAGVIGGALNTASGSNSFIGGGQSHQASGLGSFIGGGIGLLARSGSEVVMGNYNTDYTPAAPNSFHPDDRLFVLGNGESPGDRSNALTVLKNGRVGIGTDNPQRRLHVIDGVPTGQGPQTNASLVLDRGGLSNYLNILINDDREAGVLFGVQGFGSSDGGIIYNNSTNTRGLFFRTAGNLTRMTIDDAGNVGIGTTSPAYRLQVSTNSAAKPTSNTWTVASDARLKRNVHAYTDGLDALLQVRPVWFTYTGAAGLPEDTGVGVIAQELQEIAPYMVGTWTHEADGMEEAYLGVDNGAMTYMLINAVKEQQAIIEELTHTVGALSDELADIRARIQTPR